MGDLSSALNSAFDEVSSEPAAVSTPDAPEAAPVEATPAPEPKEAAPATPAEAAPEEPTGDVLLDKLSAEDIGLIQNDPRLKRAYRGLLANHTQKMQEIAEGRRLLQAIQNPETKRQAVEALARAVGIEIKPTDQPLRDKAAEVVDDAGEELVGVVGPDAAKLLRPAFEKLALAAVRSTIEPLQQRIAEYERDMQGRNAAAQRAQFDAMAKEKGWKLTPEVEGKMVSLAQEFGPTRLNQQTGQIEFAPFDTPDRAVKFLERIYRLATIDDVESETEKRILERMSKNQAATEPARAVPSTGREKRSNITKEMTLNEAMDSAFEELGVNAR